MGRAPLWQGVLNWNATDHFGYRPEQACYSGLPTEIGKNCQGRSGLFHERRLRVEYVLEPDALPLASLMRPFA